MKHRPGFGWCRVAVLAAFLPGVLTASVIRFGSVTTTPTNLAGYAGAYQVTEAGIVDQFASYAFNLNVDHATDEASGFLGQTLLGFCVNYRLPDPPIGVEFLHSTDGSNLSYDPDGAGPLGDLWTQNRAAKYNALRDIAVTFLHLPTLGQGTLEFQQQVTALNYAFAEVVADYDGTAASLDLNLGEFQLRDGAGVALTNADPIYQSIQTAFSAVGSNVGASYTLHAVSFPDDLAQDLIFLTVPESGTGLFVICGTLALVARRCRKA